MVVSKLISFTSFTCVAWRVIVHGIAKSWIQLSDQITKKKQQWYSHFSDELTGRNYTLLAGVEPKRVCRPTGTKESVSSHPTRPTESQQGQRQKPKRASPILADQRVQKTHWYLTDHHRTVALRICLPCYQRTTQQMWCLIVSLFNPPKLFSSRTQDTNKPLQLAGGAWRPAKCGRFNLDVQHRGCLQHTKFSEWKSYTLATQPGVKHLFSFKYPLCEGLETQVSKGVTNENLDFIHVLWMCLGL